MTEMTPLSPGMLNLYDIYANNALYMHIYISFICITFSHISNEGSPRGVRGDNWKRGRMKDEKEVNMEINPIYSLSAFGAGVSNLDDIRRLEIERKRAEEAR